MGIVTETITSHYCDMCGEERKHIDGLLFESAKTTMLICETCKERVKDWCEK